MKLILSTLSILTIGITSGLSQGFINLNFEHPVLPLTSDGFGIPTTNGIPGWTAYFTDTSGTYINPNIFYDTRAIDGAAVSLHDTNSDSLQPLQGQFSLLLQGSSPFFPPASASIGQTGRIPLNALSITFYLSLDSSFQVSFNGQNISLLQLSSTSNYGIMGGDISAFAGQTGQLLFTALPNVGYGGLDNIRFSSSSIPEPSSLALGALGALLFGFRRRRIVSR